MKMASKGKNSLEIWRTAGPSPLFACLFVATAISAIGHAGLSQTPVKSNNVQKLRPMPEEIVKTQAQTESQSKPESKPKPDSKPKSETKKASKPKPHPKAGFVPPPPPDTPAFLIDSASAGMFGMPVEFLGKEALKEREKELSIQYKDAQSEYDQAKSQTDDKVKRATNFEELYKEGVVSRRELEIAQREARDVDRDIARLATKSSELKGLLERVQKRLKNLESAKSQRVTTKTVTVKNRQIKPTKKN